MDQRCVASDTEIDLNYLGIFVGGSEEDVAPRTDDDGGRTEDITSAGDNIGELATSSWTPGHDKPSLKWEHQCKCRCK